jgi:GH15 family glucan-1,4-alpha-glucosidase
MTVVVSGAMPGIADYAAIGDGRSAALISRDGSIDWLCWPRFDSPSLLAALLDAEKGGRCLFHPCGVLRARRRYLGDSNVLSTQFMTDRGRARLIDLMPVCSEEAKHLELQPEHEVLRVLECDLGEVEVEVLFQPRPGYGRAPVRFKHRGALGLRVEHGDELYTVRSDVPLEVGDDGAARGTLHLRAGQRAHLSLSYAREGPAVLTPLAVHAPLAIARSVSWWQRWAERCSYQGPYRAAVLRSVLALKLMSYAPSGAIIAAPTTSLPEVAGGRHNYDYRFCWLRDASLTVTALHDLGYADEARGFLGWLIHATALSRPGLAVLYDVFGKDPGPEQLLNHWSGFHGAVPVRIKNGATHQLQLDIYGEVIDAVAHLVRRGLHLSRDTASMLRGLARFVLEHWREPDAGIWEPRHATAHHTHSLLACWVAVERLLELEVRGQVRGLDRHKLVDARAAMKHELHTRAWNERLQAYTGTLDGETVDASLLLMSWYGFEHASSHRQRSTFARIRERLEVTPGLIKRWEHAYDGAFGICCFWAVRHIAAGGGTLEEAEGLFRTLLGYANDVGLYAEETDPVSGAPLGNFPQAFTHVGLIQAALAIERRRACLPRRAA